MKDSSPRQIWRNGAKGAYHKIRVPARAAIYLTVIYLAEGVAQLLLYQLASRGFELLATGRLKSKPERERHTNGTHLQKQ